MKKRVIGFLVALAIALSLLPNYGLEAEAATQSAYSPYAMIEYGYSSTVTCGTVRYISQVSSDSYFYSAYWPSSTFGYYTGPSVECGTASLSMALSYIGVNKTPNDILKAYNGATNFSVGWGGSTYYSIGASSLSSAVDNYINGNGKYSPPVIHIPGYSAAGHYVVVVGRISSNKYQILDPWQRALTVATVNGSSATYTTYGSTTYDTIDQIHQWYNASASLDVTVKFDANGGSCSTTSKTVTPGNAVGTLPTPARAGFQFAGWYTSKQAGTAPITASTKVTKDTTFYAHWAKADPSGTPITFVTGQGTLPGATATATLTGMNTARSSSGLVLYNCSGQTVATDSSGVEIAVDAQGRVVQKRTYGQRTPLVVPTNGFVLSAAGQNGFTANITIDNYVAYDTDTMAVSLYPSKTAYLTHEKYGTSGSTYGTLPVPTGEGAPFLGWYTAETGGTQVLSNTTYSVSKLYAHWGCNHSYTTTVTAATCTHHAQVHYSCSECGLTYTAYIDTDCSNWSQTKPESGLVEEKTEYRYSDYETLTSFNEAEDGYTQTGSSWQWQERREIKHVPSWPSGFDTTSSLYETYSEGGVVESENSWLKRDVESDKQVGYLYYHWCYTNSTYSVSAKSGSYTTFHAYYSETAPSNYTCDTSDMSYKTSHSCCSNSNWFFVTDVYEQVHSVYFKLYNYERWTDWSVWSDTVYTAHDTRQVQSRTLYRSVTAPLAEHTYENGACSHCGTPCKHSWESGVCTQCATVCDHSYAGGKCSTCGEAEPITDYYLFGYINGADYACETDYQNMGIYKFEDGSLTVTFESDSYVAVKTGNNATWYMTQGWLGYDTTEATLYNTANFFTNADKLYVPGGVEVTFTLVANTDDTLTLSYVAQEKELVKPTITPKYPSLSFEGEIFYNVNFVASDVENVTEWGLITFESNVTDGTVDNADYVIPGHTYDANSGYYKVRSNGIAAKKLGDTLYFRVYAKLTDGTYAYSGVYNYSAAAYAKDRLANSTNEKLKSLCVAMLNYGAAAQNHFGHNTANPMNSFLTAAQAALVQSYSSDLIAAVGSVDSSKNGTLSAFSGYSGRYPSVSFEGAFGISYYFTPSGAMDNGLSLYYWTAEDYAAATTLYPTNATGKLTMEATGAGSYKATVSGIAAKDIDSTIYAVGIYFSGGTMHCTGVLPYSLGSYCVDRAANGSGTMQALAKATAVYGYYAKQYFTA